MFHIIMFMHGCMAHIIGLDEYSVVLCNNIAECDISKQALEDMSYQQQVDNTQQNINCSISQSMEEENGEVNNQQTLNPNTDGFMGANSESE